MSGQMQANGGTIKDLATAKAQDVAIVDATGAQITSFGGGTQYTEDAAAAANPVATAVNLVRQDTPAGLVTTDGDNLAQRGTNYGAAFVQVVSSAGAFVDTFGGGTQFADGAARSTATGTLGMVDDGTNIQSMKGDTSGRPAMNVEQIGGVAPTMGTGVRAAGTQRVTIATDDLVPVTGTLTAVTAITNALPAGNNNIGDVDIATMPNVVIGSGTVTTVSTVTNLAQQGGVAISLNTGVRDTGTQRVTIATDDLVPVTGTFFQATQPVSGTVTANAGSGPFPVSDNAGSLTVDAPVATPVFVRLSDGASAIATLPVSLSTVAVTNTGTFAVQAALNAETTKVIGTINIASSQTLATVSTVTAVTAITNALPAGTNAIGGTVPIASAAGTGLTTSRTDAQGTSVTAVKAGAGRVYGYHIFNVNTADAFLQFYDIASGSVTVGTSARARTLWIPAGGAIDTVFTVPLTFATAISIAATSSITGSGAPATGLLVDIDYI